MTLGLWRYLACIMTVGWIVAVWHWNACLRGWRRTIDKWEASNKEWAALCEELRANEGHYSIEFLSAHEVSLSPLNRAAHITANLRKPLS